MRIARIARIGPFGPFGPWLLTSDDIAGPRA